MSFIYIYTVLGTSVLALWMLLVIWTFRRLRKNL